jgi:hypothetical protein
MPPGVPGGILLGMPRLPKEDPMRTKLSSPIRLAVALAAALALTAGIGVATGAIPSSSGKIYGCFAKDGGRLRVIDKAVGQSCQSSEKALTWNQQGPKGDTGPRGPKGAAVLGTLRLRSASSQPIPAGHAVEIAAVCQPGERATGGGVLSSQNNAEIAILASFTDIDLTKWVVEVRNESSQSQDVIAQVVCAS